MADETTTGETQQREQMDDKEWRVKRLNAEIDKRKAAEKKLGDLESRLAELEDRDKPEIERLSRDLERAQKKADEAEQRAQQVQVEAQQAQRKSVVTEAAAKLGFRNPTDAALFVNLDEIEDANTAERALKTVAKERDYLLAPKQAEPAGLERVLTGDQNRTPDSKQGQVTEDELKKAWGSEMLKGLGLEPTSPAS